MNGASVQRLSGCDSSYTGTTTINAGSLYVDCLDNGGSNSSIGASGSVASNLVLNGGTLQYMGTGGSTDRQFTLGPSATSRLNSSGTGARSEEHTSELQSLMRHSYDVLRLKTK